MRLLKNIAHDIIKAWKDDLFISHRIAHFIYREDGPGDGNHGDVKALPQLELADTLAHEVSHRQ